MIERRAFLLGTIATVFLIEPARADFLPDDEILGILRQRIDVMRQSVGIVACTFDAGHQKIVSYGRSDSANGRPLDGDTVFEIGSITKVFTALLLSEMVTRGEVALDDPVAKYLPDSVKVPSRGGKQISLLDLATYTSGLPHDPPGIWWGASENPYAGYTVDQLYSFLSNFVLPFDPGAGYRYSNVGFGLLGHALALKADLTYEDLVVSRVCTPLGLADTRITPNASMRERLVQGHRYLKPTPSLDLPAIPSAGALQSTANDLVKFVRATCLTEAGAPLHQAIDLLLQTQRPTNNPRRNAGLGWFVQSGNDDKIVLKDGLTLGCTSFAGFSTRLQSGAVVLSNTGTLIDDIGLHLTNPDYKVVEWR